MKKQANKTVWVALPHHSSRTPCFILSILHIPSVLCLNGFFVQWLEYHLPTQVQQCSLFPRIIHSQSTKLFRNNDYVLLLTVCIPSWSQFTHLLIVNSCMIMSQSGSLLKLVSWTRQWVICGSLAFQSTDLNLIDHIWKAEQGI